MNLRATQFVRQAFCVKDRAGAADVIGKQTGQLLLKVVALTDLFVCLVDIVHRLLQLRRNQLAAVGAEIAVGIRHCSKARVLGHGVGVLAV